MIIMVSNCTYGRREQCFSVNVFQKINISGNFHQFSPFWAKICYFQEKLSLDVTGNQLPWKPIFHEKAIVSESLICNDKSNV